MKLWEAILRGSKNSYQTFGLFFDRASGSCALGAAWRGYGKFQAVSLPEMERVFPILRMRSEAPCDCNLICIVYLENSIIHLNDHHMWSREAIAEWVKVQEDELERINKEKQEREKNDTDIRCIVTDSGESAGLYPRSTEESRSSIEVAGGVR